MATMISVIGTGGKWDVYSALVMPWGGSLMYTSTLSEDFKDLSEAIDFSKNYIEKKIEEDKDQDKSRDYVMMIADSDLIGNDNDPDMHITHMLINDEKITVQIVPWTMEVEL